MLRSRSKPRDLDRQRAEACKMPPAPDSPGKPRLSGGTPSLSERIAALQRRNVSGPSTSTTVSPSSSSQGNTSGSSLLAPPSGGGGAASAVKDRIARLQSRGDGESPLIPRSSFGAPAPNPDVASHAVRQFPGAGGSQAGLRPQLTGAAWLNGMPAANSAALRPQQTGGMWGNQYYGAHAAHPLPRRGPSPTTPSRQVSNPIIHGDAPDAFAELDREAELARMKEAAAAESSEYSPTSPSKATSPRSDGNLPSLPSAPDSSPALPASPPDDKATADGPTSTSSALPELPEAPTETPQVKVEPSPAPPANGQSHEIEIGVRAPEDPGAQRKLENALVSSTSSLRLEPITPTSPSATQGRKTSSGSSGSYVNNPLYTDITDNDDQLLGGGQAFGTLTVLKRSRTGSSSVSDGAHGVGKAALDSMLMDGSDSEEGSQHAEPQSPSQSQRYKRQGSAALDASSILASPKAYKSRNGEPGGSVSVDSVANGSPISRGTSRTATRDDHLQSPVRKGSVGTSGFPPSSPPSLMNAASAISGLPASDSMDSAFTITSNPRTIHESPDRVAEVRRASASTASSASMSQSTNTDGAVSRVSIPRRSASVASSTVSAGSSGGRRAMPAEPPILESAGNGNNGYGNGERASSTTAASSASAAASRAREAIALARSKSQGGRLAKPPPPGRTLTAAELDASDDDYEPGWASIISRK
ncbi:hypothetical protein OC846_003717 [Tilletia horrida]|uniref:Uncharacterized protein n=1 Tax=Tilletia horrida TaxID=155126 RepID=A0AAN6JRT5_9BASI|nr:hypothetical protein OC846_003717 [Tilletia horrida]